MKSLPRSHEDFRFTCRKIAPLFMVAGLLVLANTASVIGQTTPEANMRISQIYTRGREAGAIYQSDFIELFNRGNSTVDINGWTLNITTFEGSSMSRIGIRFVSNTSIPIPAGAHLLFQFTTGGSNGQPVNGDFQVPFISLGSTGGQIALTGKDQTLSFDCPASPDPNGAVVDYVGYGSSACSEGAPAPAPPATKALLRLGGGCTDTNNNSTTFRWLIRTHTIRHHRLLPVARNHPVSIWLSCSR
jgi:hypothetical protein